MTPEQRRRAVEVTREAVREWWGNQHEAKAPGFAVADVIFAALSHFAPPAAPLPPICGMSVEQATDHIEKHLCGVLCLAYPDMIGEKVRFAVGCAVSELHRLAQPAPVADPDAEAKVAYDKYQAGTGVKTAPWEDLFECDRNGWRAVAKEKANG